MGIEWTQVVAKESQVEEEVVLVVKEKPKEHQMRVTFY